MALVALTVNELEAAGAVRVEPLRSGAAGEADVEPTGTVDDTRMQVEIQTQHEDSTPFETVVPVAPPANSILEDADIIASPPLLQEASEPSTPMSQETSDLLISAESAADDRFPPFHES